VRAGSPAANARREEPADRVSPDLLELARDPESASRRVRVIVQGGAGLEAALGAEVKTRGSFDTLGARVVELPARLVERLSEQKGVRFLSLDRETAGFGHVTRTTGADDVRETAGTNVTGLDGTGIGIAVLDSGIDTGHTAFLDRNNGLRIVYSKDFTGEGRTDDPFGHGTHVASIAAGNGRISRGEYLGVAPNANIINLRVLNSQGLGRVSYILAGLDWVYQNRAAYNIRVVNLSLGTAAVESYKNDPVCKAVRKLVDAGVVVVAAAGNNGKDSAGTARSTRRATSPRPSRSGPPTPSAPTRAPTTASPATARAGRPAATGLTCSACATTTTSSSPTSSPPATRSWTRPPWTTTCSRTTPRSTRA
jgi:serine protease AprX